MLRGLERRPKIPIQVAPDAIPLREAKESCNPRLSDLGCARLRYGESVTVDATGIAPVIGLSPGRLPQASRRRPTHRVGQEMVLAAHSFRLELW